MIIKSNAMTEPNKNVTIIKNVAQFHSKSTGTFYINISKGSYIISIINEEYGESGSNDFVMSSGLWCKGEAGTSGQPSSITYQNQKYTSGNTSMNIINDSSILLVIGQGGKGGAASLGYECRPGSDGADGSISIRPIL